MAACSERDGLAVRQDLLPNQKKAAQILNAIFAEQPNHPGVAHYLHSQLRLCAACRIGVAGGDLLFEDCSFSASRASHAVTYFHATGQMAGLGRCKPRIAGRRPRLRASSLWRGRGLGSVAARHGLLLEYAYLQLGQDHAAKELVDDVDAFREATPATPAAAYAMAAIPARYAVERRDWVLAANLSRPSATMSWSSFPTKAMISYARALGAARTGDVAGARMEIEQLAIGPRCSRGAQQVPGPIKSEVQVFGGGFHALARTGSGCGRAE